MPSHIISLRAENVKRIRAIDITPKKNLVVIGGKNANGKSSTLDAIAMALGGGSEIPAAPVRRGEKKAKIVIDLGDLVVKRTFTAEGGTQLVVENKDGARYPKPQDILDKLTGKITFDPLAFMQLDGKKQLEALKKLLGLDFSALDAKRKALYDDRTLVNRLAEQAKARAEFMPHHPEAPAEEQSMTAIVAERDAAREHNAKHIALTRNVRDVALALGQERDRREGIASEIERITNLLRNLNEQIAVIDERIPKLVEEHAAALAEQEAFVPTDITAINQRMANVETVNQWVRANAARNEAIRDAQAVADKADALTSQIEEIDRQKEEQIAAAKFPVAGLGFGEDGVLFDGLPLDQASDAQRLRVSVAIAAAMNPQLRVMLVRNGSLLDEDSMALLGQLAEETDSQVWVECVSTDAAKCSVIIEDGAVKPTAAEAKASESTAGQGEFAATA